MNLEDFVAESLVQIARGIEKADELLQDSGAIVNPRHVVPESPGPNAYGFLAENPADQGYMAIVQKIDFDVAVYASQTTETGGKAGLMVAALGVGANASTEKGEKTESRIKFSIPFVFPFTKKNQ